MVEARAAKAIKSPAKNPKRRRDLMDLVAFFSAIDLAVSRGSFMLFSI